MAETFEDELDAHIMECMKEPEYWSAHMAACVDPECKFHVPDPRWKNLSGGMGGPYKDVGVSGNVFEWYFLWLEVFHEGVLYWSHRYVNKKDLEWMDNTKLIFNMMVDAIDGEMEKAGV